MYAIEQTLTAIIEDDAVREKILDMIDDLRLQASDEGYDFGYEEGYAAGEASA